MALGVGYTILLVADHLTRLGIVVGIGILLDTFVVRTVAIPALFALLGDRMWWPARPVKSHSA